jgi:hypothetical protein
MLVRFGNSRRQRDKQEARNWRAYLGFSVVHLGETDWLAGDAVVCERGSADFRCKQGI